ncbi:MAG: hypothetical protein HYV32_05425 [Candidatus Kerfeldbacteria bacterium]|nr:hypothetical protein [Candidatus Kerfeldbacteria bacterium]
MINSENLIKRADIQKIAEEGGRIYEHIKLQYDPKEKGKFLAIDIDSEDVFLGNTSAEAVEIAKQRYPDNVFYVVKIGFDVAETMARSFIDS